MFKITANNKYNFDIEPDQKGYRVNGAVADHLDVLPIDANKFHVIYKQRSFLGEIENLNKAEKYCIIKINGTKYRLDVKDKYDELLHQLGLDNLNKNKINEIKAPMPGLVLSISVKAGDIISKGDNLFILEAMKMENIIKSPTDAIVKAIKVGPGDKVEKNQVIIHFE